MGHVSIYCYEISISDVKEEKVMNQKALRMPKRIQKGDMLGVVAPSMPVKPEEKEALTAYLQKAGYKVKLGKTVEELPDFHGFMAGDGRLRAEDINRMFADPEVDGIICARGGYGSYHTMEYLDLEMIREHPKVFIGYSDVTHFHSVFNKYCDFVTFHGPMVISNMLKGFDDYSRNSLERALDLCAAAYAYEFRNPQDNPMYALHPGTASGMVTGGNLTLIANSIGTFFEPETAGKILFLEDVEESIPVLDRMITQLELAGLTTAVNGILLGNFANCSNERYDVGYQIPEFLADRFSGYRVPVIANVCSGHSRPMGTLPMGTICTMEAGQKTRIIFKRNFVSADKKKRS